MPVLGAAGAVDLEAAFDVALVHARGRQRDALEASRLGHAIEFLRGDVVRHGRAPQIDLRLRVARDRYHFADAAHLERRGEIRRAAEQHDHVVGLNFLEPLELHRHGVSAGLEVGDAIRAVRAAHGDATGARLLTRCSDGDSGDGRLARIHDHAREAAESFLCRGRTRGNDCQQGHQHADSSTKSHVDNSLKENTR